MNMPIEVLSKIILTAKMVKKSDENFFKIQNVGGKYIEYQYTGFERILTLSRYIMYIYTY